MSPQPPPALPVIDLAEELVPGIEAAWGCLIMADRKILDEVGARAALTIGQVNMKEPNELKQAGHIAFWIRKLKPLSIIDPADMAAIIEEMALKGLVRGAVQSAQSVAKKPMRFLYVNEFFALLAAIGICRDARKEVTMPANVIHDIAVSLRYHSFSPSAITAMLSAYLR